MVEDIKIVKDKRKLQNKTKRSYTVDPAKNHLRAKGGFGDNPQNRNASGAGGFRDNPQNINKNYWWQSYRTVLTKLWHLDKFTFEMLGYQWGIIDEKPKIKKEYLPIVNANLEKLFEHPDSPKFCTVACEQAWLELNEAKLNPKIGHWIAENIEGKAIQRSETKVENSNNEELEEWKEKYFELEQQMKRIMLAKPVDEVGMIGDSDG